MPKKLLAFTLVAAIGFSFVGCSQKEAPTTEIAEDIVTETPAMKVDKYTQKADEAREKLKLLVQEQEVQQSSWINFDLIQSAYAEVIEIEEVMAEEIEAVDWYQQRADATTDKQLKKILIQS